MALGTAFRAFFAAMFNGKVAEEIRVVLDRDPASETPKLTPPSEKPAPVVPAAPKPPSRSDAIALLATLQREARLVDLIKENLSQYSDAQIGAAARPCLQQCAAALDRIVSLKPIAASAEGSVIDVPSDATAARFQWLGEGSASSGKVVHAGWEASHVQLPQWTGNDQDARVVAPVQVQRTS